jgi:hypothetical protein
VVLSQYESLLPFIAATLGKTADGLKQEAKQAYEERRAAVSTILRFLRDMAVGARAAVRSYIRYIELESVLFSLIIT